MEGTQEIATVESNSEAVILEQPSNSPVDITRPPTISDFLTILSAEIRLEIYELILPVDAFFSRLHRIPRRNAPRLLFTCVLINREAYPVFLSRNNFGIHYSIYFYFRATHDFWKYVRQVSLDWSSKSVLADAAFTLTIGQMNFAIIKHLFRFPNLQILHIAGDWDVDQDYLDLENHYSEDGAVQIFLERSGLQAFSEIPGLIRITFSHTPLSRLSRSDSMITLEKYMIDHLGDSQSDRSDPTIWKGRVVSYLRQAFGGTVDDYNEDEIPQQFAL